MIWSKDFGLLLDYYRFNAFFLNDCETSRVIGHRWTLREHTENERAPVKQMMSRIYQEGLNEPTFCLEGALGVLSRLAS